MSKVYITTAIDYINAKPHLGHVYEKVGADVAARYHRMKGRDVFLLIGADEHSMNIYKNARAQGIAPQLFCDEMVRHFEKLYRLLQIDYDRFIRTTDKDHGHVVQTVVERLWERGYIRLGTYAGKYCESCEAFIDDSELIQGRCRYHPTKEVEWVEEENYFFNLSHFQQRLTALYREQPDFVQPETWRNEIIQRLNAGLKDISISRSGVTWGIPFPKKPEHVVYVWFDALLNYLTGAGFDLNEPLYADTWPPEIQIIGKDITWFHGIIWPAILLALDLPLPKRIFAHGHILHDGQKLSKSTGLVIDPWQLIDIFGVDIIRYYLMRAIPWGQDGNFSYEGIVTVINNDLANDYGNLLSRTTAMIEKFNGGIIPEAAESNDTDREIREIAEQTLSDYEQAMEANQYIEALDAVFRLIRKANKYIEMSAPWKLAKDTVQKGRLATVLYQLAEVIRVSTVLLQPFIPGILEKVWLQLGLASANDKAVLSWGYDFHGARIKRGQPLFPRLDLKEVYNRLSGKN